MEKTTVISCSAATHIGTARAINEDRIYANGKFLRTYEADNSQVSLETSGSQFIFALSDGMDTGRDASSRLSVIEELKKYHQKIKSSSKDIQVKLDDLAEQVQQLNNLIYSMSLGGAEDSVRSSAFACLLIEGESIAAINLGNCRIYRLQANNLQPVVNDFKRTDRLLKMGIINDEQAELLIGQQKSKGSETDFRLKKSEILPLKDESVYLLCTNGLTDAVSEDAIFEMLSDNAETDAAAGLLVREAVANGSEDDITAMVIRIERAGEDAIPEPSVRSAPVRRMQSVPARYTKAAKKKSLDVAKLVSTFIMFAVIAAVLFGAFTFWFNTRKPGKDKEAMAQNTSQSTEAGKSTGEGALPEDAPTGDGVQSSTEAVKGDNGTGEAPADTVVGDNTTYKVKAGDNLMKISKQFYGDESKYKLIMQANNMTDPDKIQIGQVLKIPPEK